MIQFEAFFKMSYGLYIVSAGKGSEANGYIANSVFQVTAEPPRIAATCNKDNHTAGIIKKAGAFSISVLKKEADTGLIGLFGYNTGKDKNKMASLNIRTGETGSPIVLNDAAAVFECKVVDSMEVGTHIVFVGEVLAAELLDEKAEPITYAYYRKEKNGKAPKNAPTYVAESKLKSKGEDEAANVKDDMQRYKCTVCGHIYDPSEGDPTKDIEAGTPFEQLPDDWECPVCGVSKSEFEAI
jgi:flavin reductase (DIM6/NTAB) family NADH-FMN oxidoreductase RutF/rubredoxin